MRKLWLAIGIAVVLLAAVFAVVMAASEFGGEVVTATTFDAEGKPHETRLWIVQIGNTPFLRGNPNSGWVKRLDDFAELELEWEGERGRYQALPELTPQVIARIDSLMAGNYGLADRLIRMLRGDGPVRVIRLTPLKEVQLGEYSLDTDNEPEGPILSLVASAESIVLEHRGARFEALSTLKGRGPQGRASAVSANGRVVVGESGQEAYRFDGNQLTGLGYLPMPKGSHGVSAALAVSSDGNVVVGRSTSTEGVQAFMWQNGQLQGLGDLPGANFLSIATGVSADGRVVVGRATSESGPEAFRWSEGKMTGLGDLPGGAFESVATAVSADGRVIVGVSESATGRTAFRWEGGVMTALEGPRGLRESRATAVSADGSVIVGESVTAKGRLPFRWTRTGNQMELLPELAPIGGDFDSGAWAVSADGSVVAGGSFGAGDGKPGAFIWTEAGGIRGIEEMVVLDHLIEISDWLLESVTGLADVDTHLELVGSAIDPEGVSRSWVLRLPKSALTRP